MPNVLCFHSNQGYFDVKYPIRAFLHRSGYCRSLVCLHVHVNVTVLNAELKKKDVKLVKHGVICVRSVLSPFHWVSNEKGL